MRRIVLLLSCLVLCGCSEEVKVMSTTCDDAVTLMDDGAVLVDVRTVDEYATKRIDGSVNIPLDQISVITDNYEIDVPIIVHCQSGVRSSKAAEELISMGYETVYDLGGIDKCL